MADNNLENVQPWENLKIRVISRAFYEDAYLDFFIKYYSALGFDTITILKADTDKFDYKFTDLDKITAKLEIIPVKNEGNQILVTNYNYYVDQEYNWILNIDADEFLVFDLAKYPHGVKEFIYKLTRKAVEEHKVANSDLIHQIKLRWMCINKLNNRWSYAGNDETNYQHDQDSQQENQKPESGIVNPPVDIKTYKPESLPGYFFHNKLEIYKFVKAFGNTKWMNLENNQRINCHFYVPIPHNNRYYNLLDGQFNGVNNSDPGYYPRNGTLMKDGFILHLNTRTLANSVTKCLVTELRDNKKIANPEIFKQLINFFDITQSEINPEYITKIKQEFVQQLNSKRFFPMKIRRFASMMNRFIRPENISNPLINLIKTVNQEPTPITIAMSEIITDTPVLNQDLEWKILSDLCEKNGMNFKNMQTIINLF